MKSIAILVFLISIATSCKEKRYYDNINTVFRANRYIWIVTEKPWAHNHSYARVVELIELKGAYFDYVEKTELWKNTPFLNAAGATEVAKQTQYGYYTKGAIDSLETEAIKIVKYLVSKGANIHAVEPIKELNALHQAAIGGRERMIPILVEMGLDINSTDNTRGTPLLHAIGSGDLATVKAIVKAGGDINGVYSLEYNNVDHSIFDFAVATSKSSDLRDRAYYKDIDAIVEYLDSLGAKHLKEHYTGHLFFN